MSFDRATYLQEPIPIKRELTLLFKNRSSLIIFEIGACEGEDSIRYSHLFPQARIYAFEPLPGNVKLIESNIARYQASRVSVHPLALSSANGTAEFHVSSGRPADAPEQDWDYGNKSSSLLPPDKHTELVNFISFDERIQVETQTLESFCAHHQIEAIDFIHMDVQGAELMVLEGAGDFINNIKAIWLEVSATHMYKNQPLAGEIQQFMQQHDFVLAKDCLTDGIQGDHLYISKRHFTNYAGMIKQFNRKPSLVSKLLIKLGLILS